jgi:pimeloyl-ACP methyl ester carboxylesterase
MKFVNSFDGNKLRYRLEGEGETCLVFMPGLTCPLESWNYQRSFSTKYQTLYVEYAGHGKSGKDRKIWSMIAYAKDVLAIIEPLDLTNMILIGHSMGGSVMLELTKLIPDKIIGLIGVDTLFNSPYYSSADPDKIDEFMEELNISEETMKSFMDYYFTDRLDFDIIDPDFFAEFSEMMLLPTF